MVICMCVLFTQSCLTLYNPMVCSSPGSSVHGILQARILEWVAIIFSKEASQPRDQTWVSHIAGTFFTVWATKEDPDDGDSKVHFNFRDVKIWKKKKSIIVSVKIICQGSLFTFPMEQWSLEAFEKTDLACSIKVGLKLITANLLLKKKKKCDHRTL